jgi:hypothetical protein
MTAVTTTLPHPSFRGLSAIDWDDTGCILRHATPIFDAFVTEPDLLAGLLNNLERDEHLRPMCEGYDFMDKLVLHDDTATQVRVRLHLYRAGYFDRPHNHRWSFASRILRGSYRHRIFGRDDHFGEDTDPDTLQPIHERVEPVGATYALHHTSVHTVQAEADSISILLRGPAAKDRFLILDRSGPSLWVYGAAQESAQTRASKQMPAATLDQTIARVRSLTAPAPLGHELGA